MDYYDERFSGFWANDSNEDLVSSEGFFWDPDNKTDSVSSTLNPFDSNGNVRVMTVYWKSKRKIKKIKSYDL
jgi:hypothetical protein